jgi:uncharacterized delta-60 repeat protein
MRPARLAVAAAAILLLIPSAAYAAPGDLDPGFGIGGRVRTDLGASEQPSGVAVQPDGKIVVGGSILRADAYRFFVARYLPNGALDTGFGRGGSVVTGFGPSGRDFGTAVALQPDGRILLVGVTQTGGRSGVAIARYRPDGSLDRTFDGDGRVVTVFEDGDASMTAVGLRPDGRIVTGGQIFWGDTDPRAGDQVLVQYLPDGSIDPTFGTGGRTSADFGLRDDSIFDLVIQPDGKVVTAGWTFDTADFDPDTLVSRYLAGGGLDPAFGSGGSIVIGLGHGDLSSSDGALGVALRGDGRIVTSGFAWNDTDEDFVALGLTPTGALDTSFGGDGIVETDFANVASDVAVDPSGRVVMAGWDTSSDAESSFALMRLKPGGSRDGSFGLGGKVITDFGPGHDNAQGVALDPDGRIVVAGGASGSSESLVDDDIAVARYLP